MKLTSDVIFSCMVIPNNALTQFLIPVPSHLDKKKKRLGSLSICYLKGTPEKFKHIGNHCNIRIIFKTEHTVQISLMTNSAKTDLQHTTHGVTILACSHPFLHIKNCVT